MFLRNCWYAAAQSTELDDDLLHRRIIGEPVLFYRTVAGDAVAIGDRCPHRFAPLSKGRRQGDVVQCRYHGLRFGTDGACIGGLRDDHHVPAGTAVPSYPLREHDGIVWIWMGDADKLDETAIPDLNFMTNAGSAAVYGYLHVRADYRLAMDNLMDLSHAAILHEDTLGKLTPSLDRGKLSVELVGDRIVAAIAMNETDLHGDGKLYDQWMDMYWSAPCNMYMVIGQVPAGAERPPVSARLTSGAIHLLTPETAQTTHYIWGNSKGFKPQPGMIDPFGDEDEPMLAACQEMMGDDDFWSLRPAILPADAAGIRVRRRLEKLIREERGESLA
jgi:phenylpropionate dioxygenase-like ring-hydroxylating dioxygenase large terminal subunit